MGMLGVFRREEELKLIRSLLTNGEIWWLSKLSKRAGIPKTNLYKSLPSFFEGSLKKERRGKRFILELDKKKLGKREELYYKRADATREAIELRKRGYSYAEITDSVEKKYGVYLDSSVLSAYLRDVTISNRGKVRLKEKISKDRSKAGKLGVERQRELGILGKDWETKLAAAVKVVTKKLPENSKDMTLDKVNLIAHCLFDGFVCNTNGYRTFGYTSLQKKQVQDFMKSVYKVYGFSTYLEKREDIYLCRFSSKNAIEDLLQYTPSYSTKADSGVKVPKEIMEGNINAKRIFLRAFWDDEGAAMCGVHCDQKGYNHYSRKLEAYCQNENLLKQLLELHQDVGVPARISRKRICLSNKEGLEKFKEHIGFSEYVIVNAKRSIWYNIPKKVLLDYMLYTYVNKPKVSIRTYGCSSNKADTEKLLGYLSKMGANVVDEEESDMVVLNSCGVKQPTEDKILRRAKDLSKEKYVIMGGCLPKMIDIMDRVPDISGVFDNTSLPSIVSKVLECSLEEYNESQIILNDESNADVSQIRTHKLIAPIQLSSGCLGNCSYCSTRLARGELKSYKPESIVKEIKESVNNGAKEVWLTSQDNGCYGFDIGTNLPTLLRAVVEIPGDFKVRVGMMNPSHMRVFIDDLVDVFKDEKIFKFAHIPVQSGSNKVLKDMKRGYTTQDFESIVSKFREMDITISTDIIVGFPTETDREFKETIDLLKRTKPEFLNLSKYWPRKKTSAGEMKQLSREVVAARSKEVAELFSNILRLKNRGWLNKECSVTFTEEKNGFSVGRNSLYRPVLVKGTGLVGKTLSVKIKDSKKSELIGVV